MKNCPDIPRYKCKSVYLPYLILIFNSYLWTLYSIRLAAACLTGNHNSFPFSLWSARAFRWWKTRVLGTGKMQEAHVIIACVIPTNERKKTHVCRPTQGIQKRSGSYLKNFLKELSWLIRFHVKWNSRPWPLTYPKYYKQWEKGIIGKLDLFSVS